VRAGEDDIGFGFGDDVSGRVCGRGGWRFVGDLGETIALPDAQALDGGQVVDVGAAVVGVDLDAGARFAVGVVDQPCFQRVGVGQIPLALDLDHVQLSPLLIAVYMRARLGLPQRSRTAPNACRSAPTSPRGAFWNNTSCLASGSGLASRLVKNRL